MADQDKASKTEQATPRRVQEAARKGDFPKSQEFKSWMILASAALILVTQGAWIGSGIRNALGGYLSHMAEIDMTGSGLIAMARDLGWAILRVMSLPLSVLVIAAILGTVLQHKPALTIEKIKPKLDKISPIKGFGRLFSMNNLVEFLKTLAKFFLVFSAICLVVWPDRHLLPAMMDNSVLQLLDLITYLITKVLLTVVVILGVIAAIDFAYQRHQHSEKLKMTKQEVRDEHKQMEGDPHVKARLKQIRAERARKRMMAAVPDADVVITNPTHYAVALKYEHGSMHAPVLVAKGVDEVAFRIRSVAEEHDVPIVENPPLARSLHANVDLEEEIAEEHYKAVAEIIGYVMRLKQGGQALKPPTAIMG